MAVATDDVIAHLHESGARVLVSAINDDPVTWVAALSAIVPKVHHRVRREAVIALNTGVTACVVRHPDELPAGDLVAAYRAGLGEAESAVQACYGVRKYPEVARQLRTEVLGLVSSQDLRVRQSAAVTGALVFQAKAATEVLPVLLSSLDRTLSLLEANCDEEVAEVSAAIAALGKTAVEALPLLRQALGCVAEDYRAAIAAAIAEVEA